MATTNAAPAANSSCVELTPRVLPAGVTVMDTACHDASLPRTGGSFLAQQNSRRATERLTTGPAVARLTAGPSPHSCGPLLARESDTCLRHPSPVIPLPRGPGRLEPRKYQRPTTSGVGPSVRHHCPTPRDLTVAAGRLTCHATIDPRLSLQATKRPNPARRFSIRLARSARHLCPHRHDDLIRCPGPLTHWYDITVRTSSCTNV